MYRYYCAALCSSFICPSFSSLEAEPHQLLSQGKKKRKQVDRRASKGRKLRYHVQEKLVNFMAPVELAGHGIATQLFSSLFGGPKQS